jgi:hypothetical protein
MAEKQNTLDQALIVRSKSQAVAVELLDEAGIIEALMFHYNRYRGLKAFLLDIDQRELGYKGVSSFLIASSPDAEKGAAVDVIDDLKNWILAKLVELNNRNITLVISCPASSLYRFSDIIDRAQPPLANIDFAPLHEFDEVVNDTRIKYDIMRIEQQPITD